jgi:pyruvate dehydrogenase (quinone)
VLDFVHIEQMEAGLEPFGTSMTNPDPDFAKVAEAIGITGLRLEKPADVRDTVEQLPATPGPALLDAVVDRHALSLPPYIDDVIDTITDNALLA